MLENQAIKRSRHKGFSLVEMMVVMLISSGLVILLVKVFHSVDTASKILTESNYEKTFELFIRKQYLLSYNNAESVSLFKASSNELMFVSGNSISMSDLGRPVLAHYQYDLDDAMLTYSERGLPPWWNEDSKRKITQSGIDQFEKLINKEIIIKDIDNLAFSYPENNMMTRIEWRNGWQHRNKIPSVIKITYQSNAQLEEILIERGVIYSSSPYGF